MTTLALTWPERADHYTRKTGFPGLGEAFTMCNGVMVGWLFMGNSYGSQAPGAGPSYYGAYPGTYLRRLRALFPEKQRALHLFSGTLRQRDDFPGDTADINPALAPTFVDDAHTLSAVPLELYDIVLADPPYGPEHAAKYGFKMIDRSKVMRTLLRVQPGCHVVWLDRKLPMYRKDFFTVEAQLGLRVSTNHDFRAVTVFCRREGGTL